MTFASACWTCLHSKFWICFLEWSHGQSLPGGAFKGNHPFKWFCKQAVCTTALHIVECTHGHPPLEKSLNGFCKWVAGEDSPYQNKGGGVPFNFFSNWWQHTSSLQVLSNQQIYHLDFRRGQPPLETKHLKETFPLNCFCKWMLLLHSQQQNSPLGMQAGAMPASFLQPAAAPLSLSPEI